MDTFLTFISKAFFWKIFGEVFLFVQRPVQGRDAFVPPQRRFHLCRNPFFPHQKIAFAKPRRISFLCASSVFSLTFF
jgi:hypothetical protein